MPASRALLNNWPLVSGQKPPVIPDTGGTPAVPAGYILLLGADGAQLLGADGAPLYGVQ